MRKVGVFALALPPISNNICFVSLPGTVPI